MRNSKLGLRALGLAVLGALGMMAVFAAGAQAQGSAGKFLIAGAGWVGKLNAIVTASIDTGELWGTLLVPGRGINVKCKTTGLENAKITTETHGEGEVTFTGCVVFSNPGDAELTACTAHSPTAADGTIKASALALPRLHPAGGSPYVLFEPLNLGLNFTTIEILGAKCAAEGVYPIKGSVVAQVIVNNNVLPLIKFSEAIQVLVGDSLKFGAFASQIDGNALLHLKEPHLNMTLGVH